MAELLDAGAALQHAQQAALDDQPGAARNLRTAGAHLRAAVARLAQRAETLLVRAGHAASDATLARLAGDLDPAGFGLPEPTTASAVPAADQAYAAARAALQELEEGSDRPPAHR